jgi:hypothetical protein
MRTHDLTVVCFKAIASRGTYERRPNGRAVRNLVREQLAICLTPNAGDCKAIATFVNVCNPRGFLGYAMLRPCCMERPRADENR